MLHEQESLFGETDFRTEKEKISDSFKIFVSTLISSNELNLRFPNVVSDKKFFSLLKKLYTTHVYHGSWSEEKFAFAIMKNIEEGTAITKITLGQQGTIFDGENNNDE